MASVYYLFDDALHIADDIVEKYSQQDQNLKENHYAATVIQRSYRGYVVRKEYKKVIRAVIVLQKYTRGWLVKYRLPDMLQERVDQICLYWYNKAATKLQAAWRGLVVRKEIDIKQIMEDKRKAEQRSPECMRDTATLEPEFHVMEKIDEVPSKDDDFPFGGAPFGTDLYLKTEILDMLFDRHHLLSTKIRSGVLATNRELKVIEEVLKFLPWKRYMKKMTNIYHENRHIAEQMDKQYVYTNKKLRHQQDVLKLRNKSNDTREPYLGNSVVDDRKPFNLYSKLNETEYEKSIMHDGKYVKRINNVTRTEDKSKNISGQDFIFALKQVVKDCKVPPYYADFWYKNCMEHHFIDE